MLIKNETKKQTKAFSVIKNHDKYKISTVL